MEEKLAKQLYLDYFSQNPSLCAKWVPTEKKKLETEYDEIATEVKTYLGSEQSFKNSEGHELATYKSQIQVRFNQKKLETDLPDIYEKYSKTFGLKLEFRVFKLI